MQEVEEVKNAEEFIASIEPLLHQMQQRQLAASAATRSFQHSSESFERQRRRLAEDLGVLGDVAALQAATGQSLEERRSAELRQCWAAEATSRDLRSAVEQLKAKAVDEQAGVEAAQSELDRRRAERRQRVAKLTRKLRLLEATTGVRFDDVADDGAVDKQRWCGRLLGLSSAEDVPFNLNAVGNSREKPGGSKDAREALWGLMRSRSGWANID